MVNPYSPSKLLGGSLARSAGIAVLLPYVSVLQMATTACLAFVDAKQIVPSVALAAACSLLSMLGHTPGLIAAFAFRRKRGAAGIGAFLLVAGVGMLSVIAYGAYAFAGKSENPNSAGHMHILMFPFAYTVFASVVIFGGSVLLAVVSKDSNDRAGDQPFE